MPGRRILTATSSPVVVTAKWTWAIEAAATGWSSKLLNSVSSVRPNSSAMMARAAAAGKGRQLVLQAGHVGGELLAEQIGARREELAELDEAGAELLQRCGEALAGPGHGRFRVAPAEQAQKRQDRQQNGRALEQEQRVVARQDEPDLQEPREIAAGAQDAEHA